MDKEAISRRFHRERTESIFKRLFITEEKQYKEVVSVSVSSYLNSLLLIDRFHLFDAFSF
jgi:hypothetical protein